MLNKRNIPPQLDLNKGEVVLIDKSLNDTSFKAVQIFKAIYPGYVKKVGHAGTLDPRATGLLILCTGKMTKQISQFQDQPKEYLGTLKLGAITPSYDTETEETEFFDISGISEAEIKNAAQKLTGAIDQIPPSFSAIRVDGTKAYHKARKGEELTLKSRKVQIFNFDILNINLPFIDFKVNCSKGTYIRSLVHDFGKELKNGAYLTALRRTAIGPNKVEDAFTVEELKEVFAQIEILEEDR